MQLLGGNMKKKNLILIFSIIAVVLIISGVIISVNIIKDSQSKKDNKQKDSNIYYHCESDYLNDDGIDYYKYSMNYDFAYNNSKVESATYYLKAVFNNKEKYDNFTAKFSNDKNKELNVISDKDDKTMTRYYSYHNFIEFNVKSIDEYIKLINQKFNANCEIVEKADLKTFK